MGGAVPRKSRGQSVPDRGRSANRGSSAGSPGRRTDRAPGRPPRPGRRTPGQLPPDADRRGRGPGAFSGSAAGCIVAPSTDRDGSSLDPERLDDGRRLGGPTRSGPGPRRRTCAAPSTPRAMPCSTAGPARRRLFIGRNRSEARHQAYRALEHGRAKTACEHKARDGGVSAGGAWLCRHVRRLVEVRQQADHALAVRFDKPDVLAAIDSAGTIIARSELGRRAPATV